MKARLGILITVATIGVGLLVWQVGSAAPAVASPEVAVASAVATLPALGDGEFEYIGSKKCKMCHKVQYKSWEAGHKAGTFELLKPGQAVESKTKHNLDPQKDYTTDAGCLKCHTTGYG